MTFPKTVLSYKGYACTLLAVVMFSGCITSKKLDRFIAGQYGNELPKLVKARYDNISVTASLPYNATGLSNTVVKYSHLLPLLFYWQIKRQNICTMNPAIFVNKFTNTISLEAGRWIGPKLGNEKLNLTVEQLPNIFTIDDKGHMIWIVLYAFGWDKMSVRPQPADLVVSYKLSDGDHIVKTGEVSVPDAQQPVGIKMLESWKTATSAFVSGYNYEIAKMSRSCMQELAKEL